MKPKIIRAENLKEEDHGATKTTTILHFPGLKLDLVKVNYVE